MATENISYNVLNHELVPEHQLLSEKEATDILNEHGWSREQLPKIRRSDAAIKVLENINGKPIEAGSIVRVIRKSETAEEFVAYRLVTER